MTVSIDLWQLVCGLLAALVVLVGGFWTIGHLLFSRFETHVKEQIATIQAEAAGWQKVEKNLLVLNERITTIQAEATAWHKVEKDLLTLKAELPLSYVRREDYTRQYTIIDAKLDRIASELKLVQIEGAQRGY